MNATQSVCVVTGGTHGIGRHLADTLASDGWAVAVCARHADEAMAAAAEIAARWGVPAFGAGCDVAEPDAVVAFARAVEGALGPPAAVVANAAVLGPVGLIHTVDLTAWARALQINVCGVANTIAAFAPAMVARREGSFVTLSGGGVGGPGMTQRVSAYTSAKAAVVALTEAVGAELERAGVRVNAVAPGAIATRFMDPVMAAGPDVVGPEFYAEVTAQRRQPVSLERFDALIRFLLDPASPFITGRMLSARWESPASLQSDPPAARSSRFRLRRIDEDLYGEKAAPR
jgi:NAD(P)-dependent dehydrogenase (short-subunit alcohol dehydrogenase family)